MEVLYRLLSVLKVLERFPGQLIVQVVAPAHQVLQSVVPPTAVDNLCDLVLLMAIDQVRWCRQWRRLLRDQLRRSLAQSFNMEYRVDTPGCR